MPGKDQRSDADEHDQGREGNGTLVGGQHLTAMPALVEAALGHEDGVVVALTKDEGGQDDVDQIELDAQQGHDAQDPYPTDSHGQEGEQGQLYVAEREPEEEEDDEGTGPTHIVEVVCEVAGQGMVQTLYVEAE